MPDITVKFKDGTERVFKHEGRPGGSYTKKVKFEGGFAIITDEWYHQTVFPAEVIKEITVKQDRGF